MVNTIQRLDDPSIWKGAELQKQASWIYTLTQSEQHDITETLKRFENLFDREYPRTSADFAFSSLSSKLQSWSREVEYGRGFVLLRGLPIESLSAKQCEQLFLGICTHFGTAVSQTTGGSRLVYVQNEGDQATIRRGHRTNEQLPFHSDRCDAIGLMCIRKAKHGGESRLISASAIHNVMLNERPDLLECLYKGMPQDRRNEQLPHEPPIISMPVFSVIKDRFACRYIRRFIDSASRFPPEGVLSPLQQEALNYFDSIMERNEMILDMSFEPGDIQLINNYTLLHSRTHFDDWPEPDRRRLLLRAWISSSESRELDPSFLGLYKTVAAGAVRGGVEPRPA